MTHATRHTYALAVAYRGHGLGIAIIKDGEFYDAFRHRIATGPVHAKVKSLVRKAVNLYPPRFITVEIDTPIRSLVRQLNAGSIRSVSLDATKRALLGERDHATLQQLYQLIVDRHAMLRRRVTMIPGTTRLAIQEARRTVPLLAVALAFAGLHLGQRRGTRRRRPYGQPAEL